MDPRIRIHTKMSWIRNTANRYLWRRWPRRTSSSWRVTRCTLPRTRSASSSPPPGAAGRQQQRQLQHNQQIPQSWCCGSGMFIPDPGSKFFHPGSEFCPSRIRIKEFKYFNPKIDSKLLEIWSGLLIPDPDTDFLSIPNPWSRGPKGTGSWIRNTAQSYAQCCKYPGFREFISIPNLGFRILDPTTKICCLTFFVTKNFIKLCIILYLSRDGKFWTNWQRIIILLPKKISIKLSEICAGDPGSGKTIPDILGSKKHRIPDPQHWLCKTT